MRLLFFHCRKIEFIDNKQSTRPSGIQPLKVINRKYENILAVFICVEKWDSDIESRNAIEAICKHLDLIKKDEVLIIPFAHLSYLLADSQKTQIIIDQIATILRQKGITTNLSSFGYHKEMDIEMVSFGNPGSVAFRRFPENFEQELKTIILEYGINKTEKLLSAIRGSQ